VRVLITHECSGVVSEAFANAGHTVVSIDRLPSFAHSQRRTHIQDDVCNVLPRWNREGRRFDLMISHPDCTYLTNSAAWAFTDGPYHQKVKPGTLVGAARRAAREEAVEHVQWIMGIGKDIADRQAIENPIGCLGRRIRPHDQIIQPNQFGSDASKATCLWLRNLPKLKPTMIVPPRMVNGKPRWANQTDSGQNRLSPAVDRWLDRATTYPGIADAFVTQWGCLEEFERNELELEMA
jgi:hypothetical protein